MKKKRIASALLSGTILMSMCCFGASAAENKNDVIIFGDLNLDSSVNLLDAITSQKYIINAVALDDLKAVDESLLDINKDGKTNLLDAITLQKHLVDIDVKDYIGKTVYVWVEPEYKTVNHPAETKKVNHPAETRQVWVDPVTHEEPVYEWVDYAICNQCGAELADANARKWHFLDSDTCVSYRKVAKKVQTGTKTVTDKEGYYKTETVKDAWTETVTVKEAWTEKVLVKEGYYNKVVEKEAGCY